MSVITQRRCSTGQVFSARSSAHITPLLRELRRLKLSERIQFHSCLPVYRCLHHNATETLHLTSDVDSPRRHCSGSTSLLLVPDYTGRQSVAAAALRVRNTLSSSSIRTSSSYLSSRRDLKTSPFDDWHDATSLSRRVAYLLQWSAAFFPCHCYYNHWI